MISIILKDHRNPQEKCLLFEYDIQGIVRSYYPKEEMITGEYENPFLAIQVEYQETSIDMCGSSGKWKREVHFPVSWEDKREVKNRVKQELYLMLQELTGKSLPWGTLSGIRPTKIPVAMLEEGRGEEQVRQEMKDTYFISDEKLDLSMSVAQREIEILSKTDYQNSYSIYIGIPFCPSTCLYCSFTSYPIHSYRQMVNAYLDALCLEIQALAPDFQEKKLVTVYVGGGTPTTLEPYQLDRVLSTVKEAFDFTNVREFCVEAGRPDSITKEKLLVLKKHGVDRISINPQTMQNETLKLIGRAHTVEQVKQAFYLARECGLDNINMDFILGLPREGTEEVRHSMMEAERLAPDSITVHSLAIKRASRLGMNPEDYKQYTMENNQNIIRITQEYAKRMHMMPYYMYRQKNIAGNMENVGYAKAGKEGLYNILIIEEKHTILAFGAGASTKLVFPQQNQKIVRVENVKDVKNYIDRIQEMIARKKNAWRIHGGEGN